jgi:hypothetical protein
LADARWRPNRLFTFVTYDATRFTEFTEAKTKKLRHKRRSFYWRPWHDEQFLYDTLAPVKLLDHVDEGGWCLACGGKRSTRSCKCAGAQTAGRRPRSVPVLEGGES